MKGCVVHGLLMQIKKNVIYIMLMPAVDKEISKRTRKNLYLDTFVPIVGALETSVLVA